MEGFNWKVGPVDGRANSGFCPGKVGYVDWCLKGFI